MKKYDKNVLDGSSFSLSIGFFDEFGNPNQLLKIVDLYNRFATAKVLSKDKLTQEEKQIIHKYAQKETPKQFRDIDNIGLMREFISNIKSIRINNI